MILTDTVSLALRNLNQSKLRTFLTSLGVSIGIASLAGMVSLGVGLQEQMVDSFTSGGVFDSITVTPQTTFGRGFGGGRGARRTGRANTRVNSPDPTAVTEAPTKQLDDEAIAGIKALPGVKDVYPNLRPVVEITIDSFTDFAGATGVPMSSKGEGAFRTMTAGTFFENDTDNTAVLSLDFAKRISPTMPNSVIGRELTISYAAASPASAPAPPPVDLPVGGLNTPMQFQRRSLPFRVIGVVEREAGGPFSMGGFGGVMIPLGRARAIDAELVSGPEALLRASGGQRTYSTLTVRVDRAQDLPEIEEKIKTLGYSAISVNDLLEGAKRAFIVLDIILSLIGSIALAVSSLGIVNTMVMSILERTREIGIMKAVGGSDSDVRRIFLVEALTIGLIGGTFGVLLGWLVGRIINFGANLYIAGQGGPAVNLFSMPLWLVLSSIAFALLVSLLAGSFPARRAARLNPIQALRHD